MKKVMSVTFPEKTNYELCESKANTSKSNNIEILSLL